MSKNNLFHFFLLIGQTMNNNKGDIDIGDHSNSDTC